VFTLQLEHVVGCKDDVNCRTVIGRGSVGVGRH
jgi:hypothetical protein